MSDEKVFGFRLEAARSKVRYGRAVLTVQRSGAIIFTPIAEKLEEYRQGRMTAEDVAWTFVRTRVIGHSPSFDWDRADIDKLLPAVTAVSEDPKLEATSPAELVSDLEALERKDLEELDADRRRFSELSAFLPAMEGLSEPTRNAVTLSREDGSKFSDATGDWRQLEKQALGLFRPETVADPISFQTAIATILDSGPFATLATASGVTLSARMPAEVWPELETLISEVEDSTFAAVIRHGMEALEQSEARSPEVAINELLEAIASLQMALGQMGDSTQKQIAVGVIGGLITLLIQAVLAKAGIKL